MNPEIYAERIFVFKDAFENPEEVVTFMDTADSFLTDSDVFDKITPWKASGSIDDFYGRIRHTTDSKLSTSLPEVAALYNRIEKAIKEASRVYFDVLGIEYNEEHYAGFSIFNYDTGKEMGPHVDNDYLPGLDPICTVLVYLNDDKVGGDLHFPQQDVLVKSSAGTIVIFPRTAPYYHACTLIESGVKYHIGSGWARHYEV